MVEIAWAATRTKGTFYKARYHKIAARRGKKRALIAVGHSILKAVYHILKTGCAYKELGAEFLLKLNEEKRKAYLKEELHKMGIEAVFTELPQPPKVA